MHEQAAAALAAAEAQAEAARAARSQGDARLEVAVAALEEVQARVGVADAAREQAAATLDKTAVRAPFDGVVVLKDAEVGEVVSPNSQGASSRGSVVTMVDFDSLEVQIDLPETSLASVAVGSPASIFLDAYPRDRYAGEVLRIWPTANRQKATVEIRVGFDEPDERLRPELGARVVFAVPEDAGTDEPPAEDSILLPTTAVVRTEGARGVFVVERGAVRWQPVETGDARGGRVAVTGGLEGGEAVVADPPPELQDGDRVRVAEGGA